MRPQSPLIITPGDRDGIGYEVLAKAIRKLRPKFPILCIGSRDGFRKVNQSVVLVKQAELNRSRSWSRNEISLLESPHRRSAGYQSGWSIFKALELIQSGWSDTLVTGPIHKKRLQQGGYLYAGHTDILQSFWRQKQITMMLANSQLRVACVTTHIPLKQVPRKLTRNRIETTLMQTLAFLRHDLGMELPKIAVLGLNPHAGEQGRLGTEEIEVILPSIRSVEKKTQKKALIQGPFPADSFFAQYFEQSQSNRFDAVVCMYHDQGLTPVKLVDFQNTVNLTLGIPMIRTSVDHGTAFDIAGKNCADPSSMISAIRMACKLRRNRQKSLIKEEWSNE